MNTLSGTKYRISNIIGTTLAEVCVSLLELRLRSERM
jgi:hypothetical protein